jgi:nitrate reductase cytochrome c-type subunit
MQIKQQTGTTFWRVMMLSFVALTLFTCDTATKKPAKASAPAAKPAPALAVHTIDQAEVGFRREKVLGESGIVEKTKAVGQKPGENEKYQRTYAAPPMVPHSIAEYLPIKAGLNDCLACHTKPSRHWQAKGTPLLSDFHRIDRDGHRVRNKRGIYMGFYNCSTCHNVMTDAKPLVENTLSSP